MNDINAVDIMGKTALHWAVQNKFLDVALYLVKCGSNIYLKDQDGFSPLEYASQELALQLEECSNKLKAGPRSQEECNKELLSIVEGYSIGITETSLRSICELITEGADVNANISEYNQASILSIASRKGFYDLVKFFMEKGSQVNAKDENQQTALHHATANNHASVAQLLIDSQADPNALDATGQSPLHKAVVNAEVPMVKLLLRSGADTSISDIDGRNAIALAKKEMKLILTNRTHSTQNLKREMLAVEQIPPTDTISPSPSPSVDKLANELAPVVQSTVHSLIKEALVGLNVNESTPETAITNIVDSILEQVQQKAETVLDHTISRFFVVVEPDVP